MLTDHDPYFRWLFFSTEGPITVRLAALPRVRQGALTSKWRNLLEKQMQEPRSTVVRDEWFNTCGV